MPDQEFEAGIPSYRNSLTVQKGFYIARPAQVSPDIRLHHHSSEEENPPGNRDADKLHFTGSSLLHQPSQVY